MSSLHVDRKWRNDIFNPKTMLSSPRTSLCTMFISVRYARARGISVRCVHRRRFCFPLTDMSVSANIAALFITSEPCINDVWPIMQPHNIHDLTSCPSLPHAGSVSQSSHPAQGVTDGEDQDTKFSVAGSLGVLVCHLEYYLLFIVITGVQISNLIIQYMKQISSTENYVCSGVLKFRVFGMLTVVSPELLEGLHLLPTDHPPPCFNVLSSSVLVFQVVGMLPHI